MKSAINNELRPFKLAFSLQVIVVAISTLIDLYMPYLEGHIINAIVYQHSVPLFINNIVLLFFAATFNLLISYFTAKMQYSKLPKIIVTVIDSLITHFYHVTPQTMRQYDGTYLNSRVNQDVTITAQFIYITLPKFIANIITILGVGAFLAAFNIRILGLFAIFISAYMLVYWVTRYYIFTTSMAVKETSAHYFADRNGIFTRYLAIKAKELLVPEQQKNKQLAQKMFGAMRGNFKWHYILSTSKISLSILFQTVFFIIGGVAVIQGHWQIGTFTIILQYFNILLGVVDNCFYVGSEFQDYQASQARLRELLELPVENSADQTMPQLKKITMTNVNFAITPNQYLYSQPLTFTMIPGKLYTLVGPNGVGKTTLTSILLGLVTNYDGNIYVNDIDFKNLAMRNYRQHNVAVMLQSDEATRINVRDYLAQFNVSPSSNNDALTQAIFFEESFNLTPLLDTAMNQLSGGEQQLVILYATLFKPHTSLIILDEPFANISFKIVPRLVSLLHSPRFSDKIILLVTHDQAIIEQSEPIKMG
ncbi:ABC transporter ATP-binding protein [Periweissella fabaria]|uniref:Vitamin B12 import ATP-binding protein BtuD n=1 Tax=Periweissella fabaria TaxID=546157 RepID=A0ABM8Z3Z9_9LACO|nr:ABC transporter ATP-binding protein [Periweissella fabaria]MCM0597470.1 ABC transporter ATP-binding protein [Periweissella fabaria]CAH0416026.1 Vitamin B12 import ATP-binding protein BtuD [Periweissella fabaria]